MQLQEFQYYPEEITLVSEKTKKEFLQYADDLARGTEPTPGLSENGNEIFTNYYRLDDWHDITILTVIPQTDRLLRKDEARATIIEKKIVGKEMPSFMYTLRGDGKVYYSVDAYNFKRFDELQDQLQQARNINDKERVMAIYVEIEKVIRGGERSEEVSKEIGAHLVTEAELADLNVLLERLVREYKVRRTEA